MRKNLYAEILAARKAARVHGVNTDSGYAQITLSERSLIIRDENHDWTYEMNLLWPSATFLPGGTYRLKLVTGIFRMLDSLQVGYTVKYTHNVEEMYVAVWSDREWRLETQSRMLNGKLIIETIWPPVSRIVLNDIKDER